MEPLAKLLVSFVELAETELAMLKKGAVRLGLSVVLIIAAGFLGLVGLWMVLDALFLVLQNLIGRPGALAVSGLIFLALAGAAGYLAFKSPKPKKLTPETAASVPTSPHKTPASPTEGKTDDAASLRIAS